MNRRNLILIGVGLILTFAVVFLLTQLLLDTADEINLEALATPTERPVREDVPELRVGVPTPTLAPLAIPTATPRFTLSPVDVNAPDATESPDLPTTLGGGAYPIRLAIENIGLLASVLVVQTDPDFNIVTPREEIGYYALTPKIGGGGNSVMIGHVAPGRVFNKLLEVQIGDIVRVTDEHYEEHYYQVQEIIRFPYEVGTPEDHQIGFDYMYDNSEERITLVTCYPEYTWTHRFVVRAVPIPAPDSDEGNAEADTSTDATETPNS